IIIFHALKKDDIKKIVDIQISRLNKRLAEAKLSVHLDDQARDRLAEDGFDPAYGARPLKRAIQRLIENPLASQILSGEFSEGQVINISVSGDHFDFS
ncbi:MAG: type VI secretion system ATPase TssH, partial [Syntrophaceae bacterium]|nr:type VI secretion system ATPase TssH [Syntrophaceae bacterium]